MLKKFPKNGIVAEIGVADGSFSKIIIKETSPIKLHLIDNWDSNSRYSEQDKIVEEDLKLFINNGTVMINKGLSIDILKSFDDNYFDWVYIDSVHDYKTTAEELLICKDKVKDDGIISGDDFSPRSYSHGLKYGVIEAVHEFCVQYNWEIVMLTAQVNGHNSFTLKKLND